MPFNSTRSFITAIVAALGLASLFAPWQFRQPKNVASAPVPASAARLLEAFGKLPLSFEAHQGQTDGPVSKATFRARGNGYNLLLTADELVLQPNTAPQDARQATASFLGAQQPPAQSPKPKAPVRLRLLGANPAPQITGEAELPGKSNHLNGNDPRQWRTNVPTFAKVRYGAIYPGIDLVFYGNGRQVEYDWIVAPGADPSVIKLAVSGAAELRVADNGVLHLQDGLQFRAPVVYQPTPDGRRELTGNYVLTGANEVSFAVDDYDKNLPLVIDPVIVYSSYLGGNNNETGARVIVDNSGNAYLAGFTASTDLPTANPLQPNNNGGGRDAFIAKLNAAGSALVFSTYLGGSGDDACFGGFGVDAAGNIYIAGPTTSGNFPTTASAFSTMNTGSYDSFLAKLNPAGNALLYSTYFGGGGAEIGRDLAVNDAGVVWISGITNSTNLPVKNPLQATNAGGLDEYVAKFDTTLMGANSLLYATYFGGSGEDGGGGLSTGDAMAVDAAGNIYIAGPTTSTNLPVANAFQPNNGGGSDGFVAKLNAAGDTLLYATYLGGSAEELIVALAVDSTGSAYVSGRTASTNFPTKNPVQPLNGGFFDAFITKFSPTGSALVYSTYLGGDNAEFGLDAVVDAAGNVYVAGSTASTNFPLTGAVQQNYGGGANDAFVTQLNATGTARVFSTYLGGNNNDVAQSLTATNDGNIFVTGVTDSTNFPVITNLQPNLSAFQDAFITKLGGQQNLFSLTEIRANRGGDSGTTTSVLYGTGFNTGATVKLMKTGSPDIVGEFVTAYEFGNRLNATFDLTGKARGLYDVVVTNPNGQTRTLANGFTVEEARAPQLQVEILGYSELRGGRNQTYTIVCSNRGNVDAFVVPIRVSVPDFITLTPGFTVINPAQPAGAPPVNFNQVPFTTRIGTRNEGVILLPSVPAGSVRMVTIKLLAADTFNLAHTNFTLTAIPGKPLVSTVPGGLRSANANIPNAPQATGFTASPACIQSFVSVVFDCATVAFPPLLCANTVATYSAQSLTSLAAASLDPRTSLSDIGGTFAGIAAGGIGAALGCTPLGEFVAIFNCTTSAINFFDSCFGNGGGGASKQGQVVVSGDPNLKLGPDGAGPQHYISTQHPLAYAVLFENKPEATAAAQDVVITDQLDPAKVDLSTFELGPIGFGNKLVTPPPGSKTFTTDVDLRPQLNLFARINASLNQNTGLITWTFASIDPATGQPTTDPVAGFLPPNVTSPEGEGRVLFTVAPKAGLATGTTITNQARIVFDVNKPIDTPVWSNTIDITPPTSQVTALPANSCASFNVQWSGSDPDSGIAGYLIYVSDNGGPYSLFRSTTATSAFFIGEQGHTYRFYSIASDKAGNFEANPSSPPDAQTTVNTTISLAPTTHNIAGMGGNASTSVTAPGGCGWSALSNMPWITITSATTGAGNGTVNFTIAPNTGPARGGTLTVAGQTITVQQAAQSCTFNVAPTSANFNASGGNGSSNVTTSGGCVWPSVSDVTWITPTNATGTGSGAANYSVASNNGPARTGTLTIAGQAVTVNQASGCVYSLNPTNQNFPASGGTGSTTVMTPGSCGWIATSNVPWITITSDVNGTISFAVAATSGPARIGTLTIAGQTFTVNQAAGAGLQFYPLPAPVRLLDTRPGASPNACSQPSAPIAGQTSLTQLGRNICTIPANAAALTGNVTTVQSGGGFLTLYPSDAAQPTVANTNYGPNEIINNVFTVGLGTDGAFKIFAFNTTDVVVDVTGYYAPPATEGLYFHPLPAPVRLLETRAGQPTGCVLPGTPLTGNSESTQQAISACTGIPAAARAIVGNATTVDPQSGGFLTIFPANATRPLVAASNYNAGQIVNGPFSVGLAPNGQFRIYTTSTTHLVVDVLGYYSTEANDVNGAGLFFNPLPRPVRLLETRPGLPAGCFKPGVPLVGGAETPQTARGVCDGVTIPANALGVVGNATVVSPMGQGFLTLWPSTALRPTVATSNYNTGDVGNRHFIVGLANTDGAFKIYTQATSHLVVDLAGYFAP